MSYSPELKYLYVTRDARDVFMSLWNHYTNHTEEAFILFNKLGGRQGDELPPAPDDIHEFWRGWPGGGEHWKGGAQTFMHRGTNGRWRDILSDEELALYDQACDRVLDPACRKWLENGGPIQPSS